MLLKTRSSPQVASAQSPETLYIARTTSALTHLTFGRRTWQGAPIAPTVTHSGQEALLAAYLVLKMFELWFSVQGALVLLQKQVCGSNTDEINTPDC